MATIKHPSGTLTFEVDTIETTSIGPDYIRDLEWVERDDHAHEHRWQEGGEQTWHPVTIDWFDSDGDEYSDTTYHCNICNDEIEPGYKIDPKWTPGMRRFVPGLAHYYLDGVEITKDEAEAFMAANR
jgi:hypothetical protein